MLGREGRLAVEGQDVVGLDVGCHPTKIGVAIRGEQIELNIRWHAEYFTRGVLENEPFSACKFLPGELLDNAPHQLFKTKTNPVPKPRRVKLLSLQLGEHGFKLFVILLGKSIEVLAQRPQFAQFAACRKVIP